MLAEERVEADGGAAAARFEARPARFRADPSRIAEARGPGPVRLSGDGGRLHTCHAGIAERHARNGVDAAPQRSARGSELRIGDRYVAEQEGIGRAGRN